MKALPSLRTVSALGVIEIFAWGSSFYLMAMLAGPIAADTGWSTGVLSAGVSVGLLVAGLSANIVGSLIERHGGRSVLAAGMLLLATGLLLLGFARSVPYYFAAWVVLGLGMSAGLYDAAFSTLGRLFGRDARSAITQLTLWGGFASTICWPITAWLVEIVGWRGACFSYAALHLSVTLPLALFAIPHVSPERDDAKLDSTSLPTRVPVNDWRFLSIAVIGILIASMSTLWSVHLVTLLGAKGYTVAAAIAIGTLIGPAQVGARVLEMLGRGRHHPVWTLQLASSALLIGFAGLQIGDAAGLAMIAYGAGNGLWSIARGALPLAMFGTKGYARTMGRLATPTLMASAAAPSIGAWLIETLGPQTTLNILAIVAIVPVVLALMLMPVRREPMGV